MAPGCLAKQRAALPSLSGWAPVPGMRVRWSCPVALLPSATARVPHRRFRWAVIRSRTTMLRS